LTGHRSATTALVETTEGLVQYMRRPSSSMLVGRPCAPFKD
jgi:hypothetical protein